MYRFWLSVFLLSFFSCSPENQFLNSTQKRQVTDLSEQGYQDILPDLEEHCLTFQDSLQPYLIDSLLNTRIREMNKKLRR